MAAPIKRTPWLRPGRMDYWETRDGEHLVCADQLEAVCASLFGEGPDWEKDEIRIHAQESPDGEWSVDEGLYLQSPIGLIEVMWRLYEKLGGHLGWRGHVWIEWRER